MDNISKIGANTNFYIQSQSLKKEEDTKKTQVKQNETVEEKNETKDPNAILDAMQMSAIQNKAIAFGRLINPAKYLSQERINDIQTSMGYYENNVENALSAMDSEFSGVSAWENLPYAQKLALAAKSQLL